MAHDLFYLLLSVLAMKDLEEEKSDGRRGVENPFSPAVLRLATGVFDRPRPATVDRVSTHSVPATALLLKRK